MSIKYNVAVIGATGAVGEELFRIMKEVNFPVGELLPLASSKSIGATIEYDNKSYSVVELTNTVFEENEIHIAFFSAGSSISAKYAKYAVESGAVVIDNTSYFRMEPNIPLVVPEVNPEDIASWRETGIIANPNCSTIQMVQILKPLEDLYGKNGGIKRVDVSTYQATSGAGKAGMEELVMQMQDFFAFKLENSKKKAFAHQIALNVIPQVDKAMESGFTKEEEKMIYETQKILHKNIQVAATCVRVPVLRSHSESITITFETDIDVEKCTEAINNFENVKVIDNLEKGIYPMPILSTDTDITLVGRIRADIYSPNVLHLFNAADQIRVGAATNSVRIALRWIELMKDEMC
ncbi:Aspartate-semialdehyde dehydrogenase [hydrothermal vent metagenome]|uniref:aspartate-semialdehyde dehydrogenase n=1 Tax=hydrothermal vent metagenome TaxID=652676 RepID=A0A3B1E5R8_9ZZZZ